MIDRDIARGGCTHQRDVIYAFKFLLCLRVITSVAIWMDFALLFTLLSYKWRAAPFEVGLTAALYGFPGLVLGPWLGARADRAHPLKLLRRSYWARAIASIGLITAPSLLVFMAFVTCQGLANLVVMPSEQVLIKRTLNTAWMIRHTRYTTAVDQAAKITAPLISASLAHGFGARLGYLVSALLVIPATACLKAMGKLPRLDRAQALEAPHRPRSVATLRAVLRQHVGYRLAYSAMLLQTVVLGLYDPLLALFLRHIGMPIGAFGVIVAATACGGVLAAAVMRRLPEFQRTAHTEILLAAFGTTVLLPGFCAYLDVRLSWAPLVLLWLTNGYCYASTSLRFTVTQQSQCPLHCLGRVSATARSSQLAALVSGPLLGSALASAVGIPATLIAAGGLAIACALAFRGRRMLRERGRPGSG